MCEAVPTVQYIQCTVYMYMYMHMYCTLASQSVTLRTYRHWV